MTRRIRRRQAFGMLGLLALLAPAASVEAAQATATPATSGQQRASARFRYIWTARNREPFTAGDLQLLAANFSLVIIEKSYDHGDVAAADAAARTLAATGGHPRVLANFMTRVITRPFLNAFGASFRDEWILRDAAGKPIPFKAQAGTGWYVDLSNADYRQFIERQAAARLRNAPYAGVMFDNFHVTADDVGRPALPPGKAAQLDAALPLLLAETKALLGPGKLVYVNGVARGPANGGVRPDRGFADVGGADGVQDEFFCYLDVKDAFRSAADTWADINAYRQLAAGGQTVLHSVKLRTRASQARAAQVKRFCFGAYLMDYVPGHSLIQFKAYADEDAGPQIEEDAAPEQALDLGDPTADPTAQGDVWTRSFQRGWVAVNAGTAPAIVTTPRAGVVRSGGATGHAVPPGSAVAIPAHDALYLTDVEQRAGFGESARQ